MALIKCEECGKEIFEQERKCPYCGKENKQDEVPDSEAEPDSLKCKKCGKEIQDDFNCCPYCDKATEYGVSTELTIMKWISFILGLLGALIYAYFYSTWTCAIGLVLGLIGLIIGIKAINASKIKKGLAIAGIVLSVASMLSNLNPFLDMFYGAIGADIGGTDVVEKPMSIGGVVADKIEEIKRTEDLKKRNNVSPDGILIADIHDVEEHADFLLENYKNIGTELLEIKSKFDELLKNESALQDHDFIMELANHIVLFKMSCDRIINYDEKLVPEELKYVNKLFVLSADCYNKAIDLLIYGIDNNDIEKVNEADELIETGNKYSKEIADIIQDNVKKIQDDQQNNN